MPEQRQAAPTRRGREGGRWVNERPTSEEFVEWFTHSMKVDSKLRHEDYIGGVVLIPAVDERAKQVTGFNAQGDPIIAQKPELSYIPYAKVETRVAYFWDLLDAHEEWVGVVEHVASPRVPLDFIVEEERRDNGDSSSSEFKRRQPSAMTALTHQLPEGYSVSSIPVGNAYTHFLCCTIRVSIYDREEYAKDRRNAVPLRTGRGTKQVPLLMGRQQPYADANSLMKAETGALGRALGFAGVFVIPGSGVATAEDMMESLAQGAPPAEAVPENTGPTAPVPPPVRTGAEQQADEEGQLSERARTLWKALQAERPEQATKFAEWMRERGHRDLNVKGAALRGVVKKLEKLSEEETDVPAPAQESSPAAG